MQNFNFMRLALEILKNAQELKKKGGDIAKYLERKDKALKECEEKLRQIRAEIDIEKVSLELEEQRQKRNIIKIK